MNERIKILRKELGLTLEKFGQKIGISRGAMSNIENGNRSVTPQIFKLICNEFEVNESWLRNGTGSMFREKPSTTLDLLAREFDLDEYDKIIVGEYLKMDAAHRAALKEYIDNIVASKKAAAPDISKIVPMRLIKYYYRNASAGTGQLLLDNLPEHDIEIPDIPKYKDVSYSISVNGDSMEPTYHDGDTLLVEATQEISIGDIGIFQVDDKCYVKKLGESELISLNEQYDNIPLTEESRCLGRVVDKLPADE